jgi:hypothetical protein
MRTTIHVPDDLLARAKQLAAERNTTLTAVINDALREVLSRHRALDGGGLQTRLVTFDGGGTLPGVDLDDAVALLEVMEGADVAD